MSKVRLGKFKELIHGHMANQRQILVEICPVKAMFFIPGPRCFLQAH